jgi:hypothetical protein
LALETEIKLKRLCALSEVSLSRKFAREPYSSFGWLSPGRAGNFFSKCLSRSRKSTTTLVVILSTFLALIGSNGRIVADEYCIASALLAPGANLFELGFGHSAPATNILQVIAVQMVLITGQGPTFALGLVLLFLSLTFVVNRVLKFKFEIPQTRRFRISLYLSFTSIITLLAPAGLPLPGILEASTQQSFAAQVLLRYSGFSFSIIGFLLLIGTAMTLLSSQRFRPGYLKSSVVFIISLIAGASHPIYAALYVFLLALYSGRGPRKAPEKLFLRFDKQLLSVVVGSLTGFALVFNSSASVERISSMSIVKSILSDTQFFLSSSLDMIWWLTSPFTISFVWALVIGILLSFFLKEFEPFKGNLRSAFNYGLLFVGFFGAVFLFVGIVSYSAPWHLILPRMSLQLFGLTIGLVFGTKLNLKPMRRLSAAALAAAVLMPSVFSLSWALTIPSKWSEGPLPVQTVFSGPGSGVHWQDTEVEGDALGCYLEIRENLLERKNYLER